MMDITIEKGECALLFRKDSGFQIYMDTTDKDRLMTLAETWGIFLSKIVANPDYISEILANCPNIKDEVRQLFTEESVNSMLKSLNGKEEI